MYAIDKGNANSKNFFESENDKFFCAMFLKNIFIINNFPDMVNADIWMWYYCHNYPIKWKF